MKTVKIILLIAISLSPLTMNGQEKELKDAVKTGKKTEIFYISNPSDLPSDKYKKWANKQNDYIIRSIKTDTKVKFGHATEYVTEIVFIPMSEKETYDNYLAALKQQRDKEEALKTAAALGGFLLTAAAIATVSNLGSSSSSSSSSSNNNSSKVTDEKNKTNVQASEPDIENVSAPKYSLTKDNRTDEVIWKEQNSSWDYTFITFKQDSDGEWISEGTLFRHKNNGNYGFNWNVSNKSPNNEYDTEQNAVDAVYVWKKYEKIRKKGRK